MNPYGINFAFAFEPMQTNPYAGQCVLHLSILFKAGPDVPTISTYPSVSIGGGHVQRCVTVFRRHVDAALHFAEDSETLFPTVLTSHVHRCPAWNKLQQFSVPCVVLSGGSRISYKSAPIS